MATPKKNTAYTFYIALIDTSNPGAFKANPTIAAGDFKVSVDGGAFNNLATLPVVTPAGSVGVKIDLSAGEMNGDKILFQGIDVAGAEWDDVVMFLDLDTINIEDIPTALQNRQEMDSNSTQLATIKTNTERRENIQKNVAFPNFPFKLVLASDHLTAAPGLTVTAERLLDNGTFVPMENAVVEIGGGWYRIDLAQLDTNGNVITYRFSATTADDREITFNTAA